MYPVALALVFYFSTLSFAPQAYAQPPLCSQVFQFKHFLPHKGYPVKIKDYPEHLFDVYKLGKGREGTVLLVINKKTGERYLHKKFKNERLRDNAYETLMFLQEFAKSREESRVIRDVEKLGKKDLLMEYDEGLPLDRIFRDKEAAPEVIVDLIHRYRDFLKDLSVYAIDKGYEIKTLPYKPSPIHSMLHITIPSHYPRSRYIFIRPDSFIVDIYTLDLILTDPH